MEKENDTNLIEGIESLGDNSIVLWYSERLCGGDY